MRFVADENMYFEVVKALRELGFDVYSIAESNFKSWGGIGKRFYGH